jgi:hypothetical protein
MYETDMVTQDGMYNIVHLTLYGVHQDIEKGQVHRSTCQVTEKRLLFVKRTVSTLRQPQSQK